jgi:cytochrome c biogenesis protein CcmG/thiol:disulfide interchange protein DsbE
MKRLVFLAPLIIFAALAGVFGWQVTQGGDPSVLPSTMVDRPAPEFDLPPLPGFEAGFARADLTGGGPALVNIFASWCVPCLAEHPVITRLAENGLPVYGINYKNEPDEAVTWLARHGNPYTAIGVDPEGATGIDFGVTGVPETFLVDGEGRVRYHFRGPLTPEIVDDRLRPLLEELAG